jgi:AcrR family transcriptional regulator
MARSAINSGERRRTEILDAALRCFDRQGVKATTIEDIRTESGASIGSIYHQFASKDEILTHLYCQAVAAYRAGLTQSLRSKLHPKQGLRAAVDFHIEWIDTHRPLARIMLRWDESELSAAGQTELGEETRQFGRELGHWLTEAVTSGAIRSMTPELYAALLIGPLLEYGRRMVRGATVPSSVHQELADGIWRSFST